MTSIKTLPQKLFIRIGKHLNDTTYLKILYFLSMKKILNLNNPQTFNEKLQWLKLNDHNPKYTKMVDKYEAKKYVSKILGEKYIIPTLDIYDRFEDIDFDKLPNQFVIKCTHDSGGLVICKDKAKLNLKKAKHKIKKSLHKNYYYGGREWPYKNVKPRIIIEPYIKTKTGDLTDYKFMCYNGKVKNIFTCTERFDKDGLKVTFFDCNWDILPFERHYPKSQKPIQKPKKLKEMILLSEKLSKNIAFVRIDFYDIDGTIKFGEITFYPGNGMEEFSPKEWDKKLGDLIILPNRRHQNEK